MGPQPSPLAPPSFPSPVPVIPQPSPPAPRALPPQPSLEQLRKQAKELLAAVVRGDSAAQARLERCFPGAPAPSRRPAAQAARALTLSQAQLVIAREYGFPSWARLRQAVELAPLRTLLERAIERPIDWSARRRAMESLAAAGPSGMRVALEALSDPDARIRGAALGFIDHHATDACVPQLTHVALHDPDADVRRGALHALMCERCKPEPLQLDVQPLLIQLFREDANRRVRWTAAQALGHHADNPLVQAAFQEAALEDSSALVRRAAVGGLRGEDVLPLLAHIAEHDPDAHVRVAAAQRLGHATYLQLACDVLQAALRGDPSPQVKHDAHQALKRLSPEYRRLAAQRAREANVAGDPLPPHRLRRRGSGPVPKIAGESLAGGRS